MSAERVSRIRPAGFANEKTAGWAGGRKDGGITARHILQRPLLRGVIHVHEAEALGIAVLPFEVVQQRPAEIAAHMTAEEACERLRAMLDKTKEQIK